MVFVEEKLYLVDGLVPTGKDHPSICALQKLVKNMEIFDCLKGKTSNCVEAMYLTASSSSPASFAAL
jgi:hypothetical protein